jgi:hypothetical protein
MKLLRLLLILTILLLGYSAVVICILWPWAGFGFGVLAAIQFSRKGAREYTSMGSARWCRPEEIPRMLDEGR